MADKIPPIAHIKLAPLTVDEFIERMFSWALANDGETRLVSYLNAHNVNLAFRDSEYARILAEADLVYADGMGVVWGWRWLGRPVPERVNAGDFMVSFCRRAAKEGVSLYLLGGRPGVAERTAEIWRELAPGLKIAGCADGFFDDGKEAADKIRAASPDIVLAGMSAPYQESWAASWGDQLDASIVWCVGALFEYWGEGRSRAPRWMRRIGLEWIWRLMLEPRRMAKRYLIGNFSFLKNLLRLKRYSARDDS